MSQKSCTFLYSLSQNENGQYLWTHRIHRSCGLRKLQIVNTQTHEKIRFQVNATKKKACCWHWEVNNNYELRVPGYTVHLYMHISCIRGREPTGTRGCTVLRTRSVRSRLYFTPKFVQNETFAVFAILSAQVVCFKATYLGES